jgi:hypothetical protein
MAASGAADKASAHARIIDFFTSEFDPSDVPPRVGRLLRPVPEALGTRSGIFICEPES